VILIGNQRGGGRDLAAHLLSGENDHVTVHEVRGFASDDVQGAFQEAHALSLGTRCKQFLFSLSFNPPPREQVSTETFQDAIARAEAKLGLTNQPRVIVFHEKEGRRHAHAVWSRIDIEEMKAVPLSYSHLKLQDLSRELYLEHGWKMPEGIADRSRSDPRNFTLDEWQQAKRQGHDPRTIKTALQDAWAISDNKAALVHALKERGYSLARGDRRGYVAVDHKGEVYALPKWTGVKTKDVRARLGEADTLPSLDEAKATFAKEMQPALSRWERELQERIDGQQARYEAHKRGLIERQTVNRRAILTPVVGGSARNFDPTRVAVNMTSCACVGTGAGDDLCGYDREGAARAFRSEEVDQGDRAGAAAREEHRSFDRAGGGRDRAALRAARTADAAARALCGDAGRDACVQREAAEARAADVPADLRGTAGSRLPGRLR
jgi:hypothetical protein